MKKNISRRDFLKLSGTLSLGAMSSPFLQFIPSSQIDGVGKKNILIVVFDAFSAHHISTYGYARETTPNISKLAQKAIVYHNHYAGGNFTTPGTASLLTGTLPWTHRAFDFFATVTESLADKSLFHVFSDYYRVAYSHNPLAAKLLDQFSSGLNENIPVEQFLLTNDGIVQKIFSRDSDIASVGWARTIKSEGGYSYSLFLSEIYKWQQENKLSALKPEFPRGFPSIKGDNYFTLETVINWMNSEVNKFPRPFLGYFHFIPPHQPYGTRIEFYNHFQNDHFSPVDKVDDVFSESASSTLMLKRRQQYDEYILYVDREFGKLFNHFEETGLLNDTWIILTSDHGELFERGIVGHVTPVLYEPVIRVPLMIFEPGRSTRTDVYDTTSAVDILPTLLYITGGKVPSWSEGRVLPPFLDRADSSRSGIFVVQSKDSIPNRPMTSLTLASVKDNYKLMYFVGYEELQGEERVELYNLIEDPDELNNLYLDQPSIARSMLEELKTKLQEMNKAYS